MPCLALLCLALPCCNLLCRSFLLLILLIILLLHRLRFLIASPSGHPADLLFDCLFVWSCARLLVCSLACLLVLSFARLITCLIDRLFACLISFDLLAFFLACLLGSSEFVPWRLLDSSSRCSGARDSVLGGCQGVPRGVRALEIQSLEAAGELLEVFGGWNSVLGVCCRAL